MNVWQICLEVKEKLLALAWPYGSQESVFGLQVYVVRDVPTGEDIPGAWPFALIFPGPGSADGDDRRLEDRTITVVIGQMQEGDPMGEQAVIGGPRAGADIGTSQGRSALELASVVKDAIAELHAEHGVSIQWSHDGTQSLAAIDDMAHLNMLPIRFRSVCTSGLELQSPQNVVVAADTKWHGVDQKWGFVTYMLASAPVSPENLTPAGEIGRTVNLTFPSAATPVYVYAGYSLVGGSEVQLWSPDVVGSWRA